MQIPRNIKLPSRNVWLSLAILGGFLLPLLFDLVYYSLDFSLITLGQLCEFRYIKQNGLPSWISPLLGGGEPLFANFTSQILYPVRWLERAFDPETGGVVGVAVHYAVAFPGTVWLARTFGLSRRYATIAGLLYLFSGTVLDLIPHSIYIVGGAWLPWAWAATRSLLRSSSPTPGAMGVLVSFAALVLGGEPQSWVIAHLIFGIEALSFLLRNRGRTAVVRVALSFAFVACSDLFSSAQWIPALAEMKNGLHLSGAHADVHDMWNFGPTSWLASVWRNALDNPIRHIVHFWALAHRDSASPGLEMMTWNRNPYLGFVWLLMIPFAAFRPRFRNATLVFALALILALGSQTPFAGWIEFAVPILKSFRYPSKYLPLFTLAAAILGAAAIQSLQFRTRYRRVFMRLSLAVAGLNVAAALAAWIGSTEINRWAKNIASEWPPVHTPFFPPQLSTVLMISAVVAVAPLLIVMFLFVFRASSRRLPLFVAGVILFDLAAASVLTLPIGPKFDQPEIQYPLEELLGERIKDAVICHEKSVATVTLDTSSDSGRWPQIFVARLFGRPNIGACDGLRMGVPYSAVGTRARNALVYALGTPHTYGEMALGCTHLITLTEKKTLLLKRLTFPIHPDRMDLNSAGKIYEVVSPLPREFVPKNPVLFSNEPLMLSLISKKEDYPSIIRAVDDPKQVVPPDTDLPSGDGVISVSSRWDSPSRVEVSAQGTGGAIVGIKTVYAAGWQASQGGRPLRTLRVAGVQMGAWVENVADGPILFEYRPPYLRPVLVAAAFGLILFVLLLWIARRTSRRRLSP